MVSSLLSADMFSNRHDVTVMASQFVIQDLDEAFGHLGRNALRQSLRVRICRTSNQTGTEDTVDLRGPKLSDAEHNQPAFRDSLLTILGSRYHRRERRLPSARPVELETLPAQCLLLRWAVSWAAVSVLITVAACMKPV